MPLGRIFPLIFRNLGGIETSKFSALAALHYPRLPSVSFMFILFKPNSPDPREGITTEFHPERTVYRKSFIPWLSVCAVYTTRVANNFVILNARTLCKRTEKTWIFQWL